MGKPQQVDRIKMGNFLYDLRKEKGISQTQLGLLLGVTNKAVSKWETGENQPEVAMLYRLADFYRLSVDEIIKGERNCEPKAKVDPKEKEELSQRISLLEKVDTKSAQRFYFVGLFLMTVVLLFFVFFYAVFSSFLRFSDNPVSNGIIGFLEFLAIPVGFASLWTGIQLFVEYYPRLNPVLLFVGLILLPLSLSVLLILGFFFLIPKLLQNQAKAFPKSVTLSMRAKRFARFTVLFYAGLFLLAVLVYIICYFIYEKAVIDVSIWLTICLFASIACFTFFIAFFAKKEEILL